MTPEVSLRSAGPADADRLAELSAAAFESDLAHGAPGPGGPPGYDDPGWQRRMLAAGDVFCIESDGDLVGGAVVFRRREGEYELGRIWVDPSLHRTGVGRAAMELVMGRYPNASRWVLDTPEWNRRTRAFYEELGFEECGRVGLDTGFDLIVYEKRLDRLF